MERDGDRQGEMEWDRRAGGRQGEMVSERDSEEGWKDRGDEIGE